MTEGHFLLLGRILIAMLFLPAGVQTIASLPGGAEYFAALGLPYPAAFAYLAGVIEITGGALMLFGYRTRFAALVLALFAIAAALIGHLGQGGDDATLQFMHSQMMWKDIAIAGGLFVLAAAGAGRYSVDARR